MIPARRTSNSAVVEAQSHTENHVKVAQSSSDPSISQVNWGHLLLKYLNAGIIWEENYVLKNYVWKKLSVNKSAQFSIDCFISPGVEFFV